MGGRDGASNPSSRISNEASAVLRGGVSLANRRWFARMGRARRVVTSPSRTPYERTPSFGAAFVCAMILALSDGPPTRDQQDTGSRDCRALSVAEAADRLGITPDAVRGRLHRGTLYGQKVGTEWRVFLPETETPTAGRQDATVERQATDRASDGPLVELVANLARRNEELAAAAAMWQSRAAHFEDRLLALGAGEVANVNTPQPPASATASADHFSLSRRAAREPVVMTALHVGADLRPAGATLTG